MKLKKYVIIILSIGLIFSPRSICAIKPALERQLKSIERSLAENAMSENPENFTDGHLKLMRLVQENLKDVTAIDTIYYSLLPYSFIMGIYSDPYEHWPWDLCNIMRWLREDGICDEEPGKNDRNDVLRHKWRRMCDEFQTWIRGLEEKPDEEFVGVFLEILYEIYKTSYSMCHSKPLNFKCIKEICVILSKRWNLCYNFPELEHCSHRCGCCIM